VVLRRDAIRERLAKLEEVVSRLEGLRQVRREDFLADFHHQWLAERGLELGAQVLLDIGAHILAGHFGESATDNEDVLVRLGRCGVLSPGLQDRLRGLGGFRNLLAHGYLAIDPPRVWEVLQRSVIDFTDFEAEILAWLDKLDG
jgi:uncharacterized protein YutE (UPF0331/DUF86 family)